ncbi:MAG: glycine oxidase ThiO [Candidatus Poribacteria bacterium]|nr:glycine oxidase ThiO [Candidatus Poribacteria bacterium]
MRTTNLDVLIVGGGVIGLMCGWELAGRGASVLLLERNAEVGREASWAAAGFLRHRVTTDDAYGWLSRWSHERYPTLHAELLDATGIDSGYRQRGGFELAFEAETRATLRKFHSLHVRRNVPVEWVEPEEVVRREPNVSPNTLGGTFHSDDAQIRPPRYLRALASAFEKRGGRIVTNAEVASLRFDGDRCLGVESSVGSFSAGTILLTAGCWSGGLAERAGLYLPVRPVRGQVIRMDAPPEAFQHTISAEGIYLAQRDDGAFLVGATVEEVGYERGTTDEGIAELRDGAERVSPMLARYPVTQAWSGFRPAPAKRYPYIGEFRSGLWVATAHFRVGLMLAPATGKLVADGILTGQTPVPLDDVNPERDG